MEFHHSALVHATRHAKTRENDHKSLAKAKEYVDGFKHTISRRIDRKTVICVPVKYQDRIEEYLAKANKVGTLRRNKCRQHDKN